jgi:hypothetical protein
VGSNPNSGTVVWCVCVFILFVMSCVSVEALRRGHHSSKESYRLQIDQELEKRPRPTRAVEPLKIQPLPRTPSWRSN